MTGSQPSAARIAEGEAVGWCIADVGTDRPLGHIHCFRLAQSLTAGPGHRLGYWLHPEGRGRGAVTEALELLVGHAFADPADGGLGLHRLEAGTDVENVASERVLPAGRVHPHRHRARDDGPRRRATRRRRAVRAARTRRPPTVRCSRRWCWRGAGVRLRPWRSADEDRVAQACTDPVTRRWLGDLPAPYRGTRRARGCGDRSWTCGRARPLLVVADPATDEAWGRCR